MRNILIIGATSAIAQATARCFSAERDHMFLVARDPEKLSAVAEDLKVRGASKAVTRVMDAVDFEQHWPMIDEAVNVLGSIDVAIIAHGTLPSQKDCENSFESTREELSINCLSVISMLTHLANYFESLGSGTVLVLSSVAGDRGRQSNYVYGAAKGAVAIFLQGLRNRLHSSGVNVSTVKLGFVDTPMTSGFTKGMLWSNPQKVGRKIHQLSSRGGGVFYVPWYWRFIMLIVKWIPEGVFKRMGL